MSVPIIEITMPTSKYGIKCPFTMEAEELVVHNTANDATAKAEVSYMIGNDYEVSYHYAVDDVNAVLGVPLTRNAWHAGDGANGRGNRYGIGVEICYSKSGGAKFVQAEKNGAWLCAQILKSRGWGIERMKKHQDYSGKYCPHRTLDLGWARFVAMVVAEMGGTTSTTVASGADIYTVKAGDTLFGISKANGISVGALKTMNGLVGNTIHTGDKLKVRVTVVEPAKVAVSVPKVAGFVAENGTFTVTTDKPIRVRTAANTNAEIVASYSKGESVVYNAAWNDGRYVWIRYTSGTGKQRYMVVRDSGVAWGTFK